MVLILLCLICTLTGCQKPTATHEHIHHVTGNTMGTTYSVKWVDSAHHNADVIHHQINERLKTVNHAMSTYDPTSEISAFNEKNVDVKYKVSNDFFDTLTIAQAVSVHTKGAFDVTLAPIINLWGFGHKGKVTQRPSDEMILAAQQNTGYQKLELIPNKKLIKKTAPITLNLSAVAKGYGVDAIATMLEHHKINRYFIEIGGEVYARGDKPDNQPWKVGIERPTAHQRELQSVINISGRALATSGDYRNYFEENGIRYSHTIDPITGKPISHKLASVSVLHSTCAEADAYATALMVMGDKQGIEFAKSNRIDALFVIKSDDAETGFTEIMTGNFSKHLVQDAATASKTAQKPTA